MRALPDTPGARCQSGRPKAVLGPPPPASATPSGRSFHTVSVASRFSESRVTSVPPTPVTHGEVEG